MLNFNKKKYVSFDNLKSFNGLLQSSLKEKIDGYKSEVEDKVQEKFNELSGKAQGDSEVIDARKGEASLRAKIDVIDEDIKNISLQLEHDIKQIENIHSVKISARELNLNPDTDITQELQNILNDNSNKYQIEFEKNREYILTDSIVIDLNKNSILGNGCTFSSKILDENKYAFILTSSLSENPAFIRNGGSPTGNIVNTFNNCIIQTFKGDDQYYYSKKSNGVLLSNLKGKSAHLTFDNLSVLGFNIGVSFGSQTYMCTFNKINIAYCGTAIALKKGFSDMGERLHFCNGCVGDSNLMILNETDQALHFHNMSFDFSDKLFDNSGQLYFTNCHIEAPKHYFDFDDDERNYWGDIRGTGSVFIDSSRLLIAYGDSLNRKLKYLFKANSETNGLYLNNCHTHIFANYLLNNVGICKANNLHKYNTYSPYVYLQEKQNLYVDENCENINNIVSSNSNAPVVLNNGYECTHLYTGVNQHHKISLPKLTSDFKIVITFNTDVKIDYFFNIVKIKTKGLANNTEWNLGSVNSVIGENTLTIHSYILRHEGKFFNPNIEYELVLNSFGLPNSTKFTINKIIINQVEN